MFFGEVIGQQNSLQISTVSKDNKALQLTNAVLDIAFTKAELYLRAKDKEILLARLNPDILQSKLNILIDLQQNPSLIAKNGNVHVCGHFTQKSLQQKHNQFVSESIINTNKKINQLSSQHIKEALVSKEPLKQKLNQNSSFQQGNQKYQKPLMQCNLRQSSRLSTRRASNPTNQQKIQISQKSQTLLKKDMKSDKKKQKSQSLLKNGRYSLKALLQNIDDDQDQDSDEQFSNSGQQQESDDDSQFQEDQAEQDEDTNSKSIKSQSKQSMKKIKRSKHEDELQLKDKQEKEQKALYQQKQKVPSLSSALKTNLKPQIEIGQQEDSDNKKQINTEQYQEKWPQVVESQVEKEANQRQQKISQLAAKIKCPTKKPTI